MEVQAEEEVVAVVVRKDRQSHQTRGSSTSEEEEAVAVEEWEGGIGRATTRSSSEVASSVAIAPAVGEGATGLPLGGAVATTDLPIKSTSVVAGAAATTAAGARLLLQEQAETAAEITLGRNGATQQVGAVAAGTSTRQNSFRATRGLTKHVVAAHMENNKGL